MCARPSPSGPEGACPPRDPRRRSGSARRCLLLALLAGLLVPVALAHSPAEMGVTADQFDHGIPVYWPYHVALMTTGFVLLLSGFVVMRYHRTRSWFRNHQRLQAVGGVLIVAGLSMSIYMVQLSGVAHLHYAHGILGAGTIALTLGTLALGYVITRGHGAGPSLRRAHRYVGGLSIALVAVNIALGLAMLPSTLAQ